VSDGDDDCDVHQRTDIREPCPSLWSLKVDQDRIKTVVDFSVVGVSGILSFLLYFDTDGWMIGRASSA